MIGGHIAGSHNPAYSIQSTVISMQEFSANIDIKLFYYARRPWFSTPGKHHLQQSIELNLTAFFMIVR